MYSHFKLMHLILLIGDAGQSHLSNQGALPLHYFALTLKKKFCLLIFQLL